MSKPNGCGAVVCLQTTMADDEAVRRRSILNAVAISLQLLLDDSSSSSEEEETMLNLIATFGGAEKRRRVPVPRLKNYIEEVIPRWSDRQFQSHFRMCRATFEYVLGIIAPTLRRPIPGHGRISPDKQFLICIWRMATPDSYRSICEKFDVSRSTALTTVRRVTQVLVRLAPGIIRWPTVERAKNNWRGFEAISAFPKVLGAIDGTHIHIPAPKINPEAYINRKGFHSVQLQAICDHKTMFLNCLVGHVGSVHDQRVFRLSEIESFLGSEEKFPDDCHLLGDAAYKLHQNLLVPYRDNGHLTVRQKNFNFCHSSARIAIERAFGLLKGRFRSLLHCLPMTHTKKVPDFVLACCVLHNICVLQNDELTIDVNIEEGQTFHNMNMNVNQAAAVAKRDLICETLIIRNV